MKLVRSTIVSIVVLIALAALVVACGREPSETEYETYSDADYAFTLQYPSGWKIQESAQAEVSAGASSVKDVGIYDPNGATIDGSPVNMAVVSVYKLHVSVDESMLDAAKEEVDNALRAMESQDASWQRLEELTATQVGEIPGFRISYKFSMDDTLAKTSMYFLFHGDTEYQLIFQTVEEDWADYQDEFTTMLESFSVGE